MMNDKSNEASIIVAQALVLLQLVHQDIRAEQVKS